MKKYLSIIFYTVAAVLLAGYCFAESTLTELLLLCLSCGVMWLGGICRSIALGDNKAMQVNLKIYLGLFLVFFVTLTLFDPAWGREGGNFGQNVNLVPFKTITEIAANGSQRAVLVNIGGNIACLMPLGLLLPLNFKKQENTLIFLATVAAVVTAVELLQLLLTVGVCDIDDLILNVFGAMLVFALTKINFVNRLLRRIFLLEKGEIK